ncbi:MAG: sugar transferase [Planctomycetes bacterium]|nr:sugar transferase [Planctomycetota bacterium]
MSTHSTPVATRSAVVPGTIERLTNKRGGVSRATLASQWARAVRVLGQACIQTPVSMWLVMDVSILSFALFLGYRLFPPPAMLTTPHVALWQAIAVFSFVVAICSLIFGLHEREALMSRSCILTRMLLTSGTAVAAAYAIIYVVMYATISRRVAGLTVVSYFIFGSSMRLCACWAIHKTHRGLLIVGSKSLFESFASEQKNGLMPEYRLIGFADHGDRPTQDIKDSNYVGTIGEAMDRLGELGVTEIVVGSDPARDPRVMDWMVPCLQRGCRVTNEAIFYERATGQILVEEITPHWFLFADLKAHCDEHATLKRLVDLLTGVVGLCLTAPFWPLIALAVKLGDGGPVFYGHDRVGQNGKIFRLHKFRTMRTDAENGKSVWSVPNDPRVTRVGRFLRRTRLDELPQLYNVIMGHMSIVGPRPERPDIVGNLCEALPYYAERHLVKPGVTGWAQISFRYGSSIADAKRKLQFDLYYLKHMSFELDIMILFRTLGTFLRGAC